MEFFKLGCEIGMVGLVIYRRGSGFEMWRGVNLEREFLLS